MSMPIRVIGRVEMDVPTKMTRLQFNRDDLGLAREVGGFTVTMTGLTQRSVVLDVRDENGGRNDIRLNPIVVAATDHTGQFLSNNASSRGPVDGLGVALAENFDAFLTSVEQGDVTGAEVNTQLEARFREVSAQFQSAYTVRSQFQGEIETVDVLLAVGAEPRSFPLDLPVLEQISQVAESDEFVPLDFPVSAVAFAPEFNYLSAPDLVQDLDPEALDAAVIPISSIFWTGQERVKFFYPPHVASGLFMSISDRLSFDAAEAVFLDESGQPVDPQPTYEFQSGRLEFTVHDEAARPVRVAGNFDVRLMSDLRVQSHMADALPEAVQITANQVIRPASEAKVLAVDGLGRFLRRFHSVDVIGDRGVTRQIDYYYGQPMGVVVVTPGPVQLHPFRFETDLTMPVLE